MTSLLLVGGTGAIGARVLDLALADSRIERVVALTRRPVPEREGLENQVVNLGLISSVPAVDAVICALGTTRKEAGSRDAFRHVDHDLPVRVAELARDAGAATYALVSSVGADAGSRTFYLRVKGETEQDLRTCGYESLTIVRPSGLYGGTRARRLSIGDHLVGASRVISSVIPARYRPVHVDQVARMLIEAAVDARPGVHVRESETL